MLKMKMELMRYKLEDIADFNKTSIAQNEHSVIDYLDTGSITENVISEVSTLKISDAPSRAQRKVTHNTIVYSTVRPRLKHYGILSYPKDNFIVSTGFTTIDIKDTYKDKIDAQYLYLLLTQSNITEYLVNIADTAVSAYPSIKASDISTLTFKFPDIEIQRSISRIWHDYHSNIELNRVINQNCMGTHISSSVLDLFFCGYEKCQ